MPPIHRVAQTDAINEALEIVEAHLNNVGMPSYNTILLALEQIDEITSKGEQGGLAIRDAVQAIAAKALGK